jgi:hypothetical protein
MKIKELIQKLKEYPDFDIKVSIFRPDGSEWGVGLEDYWILDVDIGHSDKVVTLQTSNEGHEALERENVRKTPRLPDEGNWEISVLDEGSREISTPEEVNPPLIGEESTMLNEKFENVTEKEKLRIFAIISEFLLDLSTSEEFGNIELTLQEHIDFYDNISKKTEHGLLCLYKKFNEQGKKLMKFIEGDWE